MLKKFTLISNAVILTITLISGCTRMAHYTIVAADSNITGEFEIEIQGSSGRFTAPPSGLFPNGVTETLIVIDDPKVETKGSGQPWAVRLSSGKILNFAITSGEYYCYDGCASQHWPNIWKRKP